MLILGLKEAELAAAGGLHTAQEIVQQPQTLRAIHALLQRDEARLSAFLLPLINRRDMRVILTGAGTSAFIGECLVPYLTNRLPCRVEAIATTDIVAGPDNFLERDTPTLLISFGRSGNSPESVAAIDLADQLVAECHHLAITCNAEGALAKRTAATAQGYALTLPDETHDRGFAMTSSFTGMMYAALTALIGTTEMADRIDAIASAVEMIVQDHAQTMQALAERRFERVVYLGSNGLKGLAREAALKLLELSDGKTVAIHDSPLGFRHGPKTIVTEKTLVVVFVSNDPYTRRYDLDLIAEIGRDGKAAHIVAISTEPLAAMNTVLVPALANAKDCDLLFAMIVAPQMLAFYTSLTLSKTPDNPNAAGIVNRVVQGVSIHALQAA
jgi:tagatose-6-phosphate ketose/aldose isomerase